MERAKIAAHNLMSSSSTSALLNPSSTPQQADQSPNATSTTTPNSAPWSVSQALSDLPTPIPPKNPTSPLPFLHTIELLKSTPRKGWLKVNPPFHTRIRTESIADHMYRMSILTLLCPSPLRQKLNIPRCTLLALVHDMAECLVGDITPADEVPKPEKSRRERETMDYLTHSLLGSSTNCLEAGQEIKEAWEEYEDSITLESKFVHDVDKLELILQMMEYERKGEGEVDLHDFTGVAEGIKLSEMKAWCRDVFRERVEFWKGVGKVPKEWEYVDNYLKEGDEGKGTGKTSTS